MREVLGIQDTVYEMFVLKYLKMNLTISLYPIISLIEKYRHFLGKIQLLDLGFGTWGIILTWLAENIKIFVPQQIMYLCRRFMAFFQHGFECLSWNVLS